MYINAGFCEAWQSGVEGQHQCWILWKVVEKQWILVYLGKRWHLVSLAMQAKGRVAKRLQQHQLPALAKQGMWLNCSYFLPAALLEGKTLLPSLPADVLLGGQIAMAPGKATPRVPVLRLAPPCAPALPRLRQKISSVGFNEVHNTLSFSPTSLKSIYPVVFIPHTDKGTGSYSHIPAS